MAAVRRRLLILGGTSEAVALADRASALWPDRLDVITSLAGRVPPGRSRGGRLRVGGFGGADGLARYLRDEMVDLVVDATHPFAAQISRHAETACAETETPRLMLVRPPWRPEPGDRWTLSESFAAAAGYVATHASRAFLTIGIGEVAAFSGLATVWFLVRTIEEPATPLPLLHYALITGRPPFALADERALLKRQRIGLLVTKNAGGPTATKLIAARDEGVPVLMIARPPQPPGTLVEAVDGALDWLSLRL